MGLFDSFGINWKLIAAQTVNFFILLWLLRRLLVGPLLKFVENREQRIEQGLSLQEKMVREQERMKNIQKQEIAKAQKAASDIVAKAQTSVDQHKEKAAQAVALQVEKIMKDAALNAHKERSEIIKGTKDKIGELAIACAQKILTGNINQQQDAQIIKDALRYLNEQDI